MKIAYIISTCDKYLETRVKNQLGTFLKSVKKEDIYYLTSKSNEKERQFGWNCMDYKTNLSWKYIHFIYNMTMDNYDWVVFIQDDSFVFTNRLEKLLENSNSNENYYIGRQLESTDKHIYMSGSAGFIISKNLYNLIHDYVKTTGINNSYKHEKPDITIGIWIEDISKHNNIKYMNNLYFNMQLHNNDDEIETAITFHKVIEQEQFDFYTNIKTNIVSSNSELIDKTVFVLVTDQEYFSKAKRTIIDLRSRGKWHGKIVLITIDFELNSNFKDFYNIIEKKFDIIDKSILIYHIGKNGFHDTIDKRELTKLNQWEKLHVFDDYFKNWQRVVFLDAGLRVFDDVKYLLDLDCTNKILAPKDGKLNNYNIFKDQLSNDKPDTIEFIKRTFGSEIMDSHFMLNCMWMYDTNILNICNKTLLISMMNSYTCCKTNEMGIMNLMFHFKFNLWEPLPTRSANNKFLFDWCELNQNYHTTWRDYCFIKYPVSIRFEDT